LIRIHPPLRVKLRFCLAPLLLAHWP
jgi:hypothetical protein